MKICPTCGEGLADEAKFCPVDGTSLQGVVPTAGSPPASGGPAFARTLYGVPGVVPPQAAPQAPAAPVAFEEREAPVDLNVRPTAPDDMDVSVTPSDAMAPVPVAAPVALAKGGAVARSLPKRRPKPKSLSLTLDRPRSPVGMAIAAGLAGAALVGLVALGAKVLKRPKRAARPPAVSPIAVAPASPSPPALPPPPPAPAPAPVGLPVPEAVPAAPPAGAPLPPTASPIPQPPPAAPATDSSATGQGHRSGAREKAPETPAPASPGGDPKQADIYVRAGREHLSRGAYAKAQVAFEQARAYDPVNAAALAGLGEVAFEQGDYAAAVEKLRAAVRLNRNSRYLTLLGNSYFKLGQYKQAVEQYKRALQLESGNKEAAEGLQAAQKKLRGG